MKSLKIVVFRSVLLCVPSGVATLNLFGNIILASKEFGMIYFFPQISRLSIYIKISALFGWDTRIFYSWKIVIFGINHWQMNLVMFWCSGVATPDLYLASLLTHWLLDYLVVILLTSCAFIQIFTCWLWWRLSSYCVSLWCIIMQLMGNILGLIMEGFGSCLGEHPLLFSDFLFVKHDEFFADHHRELLGERELNTNLGLCSWVLYTLVWGVLSWCCDTLGLSVEWIL